VAFTAGEVTNIANAQLDYYLDKGDIWRQTLQKRPAMDKFVSRKKYFSGGKGDISIAVSGAYGAAGVNDGLTGYTHNDTVVFYTPANIKRANFPWREHHIGLQLTHTELKIDGISVVDPGSNGEKTTEHSRRELHTLVNLLEDKLFDLGEQYARKFNALLYGDGVADPKALAGLKLLVADDPSVGTVGGINRATAGFEWWRNRARTAAFGTEVIYDPSLDDLGLSKRGYWLDTSKLMLMCMEDEWMHKHTPARPYNQFLMYRSITSTCQLIGKQFNSSLVIDIV
jgi:hypothetical protein